MLTHKMMMGVSACLLASLAGVAPAAALTQKECSEKYQAAKTAGTLGGKSWNDYRKTECAANAPAAATESATKPAPAKEPAKGGLKWIVKGGGYYSECNKRLKG